MLNSLRNNHLSAAYLGWALKFEALDDVLESVVRGWLNSNVGLIIDTLTHSDTIQPMIATEAGDVTAHPLTREAVADVFIHFNSCPLMKAMIRGNDSASILTNKQKDIILNTSRTKKPVRANRDLSPLFVLRT